ncbi:MULTISPECIES: hypothetical protein [unclassified Isoptericola]|uniref:hypothetical protein n=1 Tax=unclassified Isoptericola TaxID=2623355 RepID=UPI0027123318|nr:MULTISPECIES: hypothetical protein [unclassified Isoptericola]MDO8143714.1 hypothetical protein [Isoptericola sp. 178]MDO8147611.1 hypothetical protein [Isoptericola sp. b515]
MTRDEAMWTRVRRGTVGVALVSAGALVLAGCGGADEPGGEPSSSAAASEEAAAPAVESSCTDGVVVEWQGEPDTQEMYTSAQVIKVGDDGLTVRDDWQRGEEAGARHLSDADGAQRAVVSDAVAGGLLEADQVPRPADPAEALAGAEKGKYVLYDYAKHRTQTALVSCADGSTSVEVAWTGFEIVESGVANCAASPDPVADIIAADAITGFCVKG